MKARVVLIRGIRMAVHGQTHFSDALGFSGCTLCLRTALNEIRDLAKEENDLSKKWLVLCSRVPEPRG